MTKGALGWWAVRFLAAAGVSSVACSATHLEDGGGAGTGGRGVVRAGAGGSVVVGAAGGSAPVGPKGGEATDSESGSPSIEPTPEAPFPCLNPTPYANPDSGLEACDNGMVHRVQAGTCAQPALGTETAIGCVVDEDCPPIGDFGSICACDAQGVGRCVRATCSSDAGCNEGSACVGTPGVCLTGTDLSGFACLGVDDDCGGNADCGSDPFSNLCVWAGSFDPDPGPRRICSFCSPGAGRPFLVDASARTARTAAGGAWSEPSVTVPTAGLDDDLRAVLTAHWQHQAEMEHASVAAFARFVLELLSLGAPPDLVTAATDALADETAHARVCYALASGYAGQGLGPTELDVSGALADLSLEGIVTRAVLEGCVGETLAALEMSEAANHTVDQALRDELSRIAEDEARHAELSWRFLGWALSKAGAELHHVVRSAFHRAEAELRTRLAESVSSRPTDAVLLAHGLLPSAHSAQLALDAFKVVIEPCVTALLVAPSPNGDVRALSCRA